MDVSSWLLALGLGLVLSMSAGLRAFIPPFALSVLAYLGVVDLGSSLGWLGSSLAVTTFSLAIIVELLADKIPALDHAMDVVHVALKPAAGALTAYAFMDGSDPLFAAVASVATGGVVAGGTHVLKAGVRLGSTATTGGAGNPLLSIAEDVVAIGLAALGTWGLASFA